MSCCDPRLRYLLSLIFWMHKIQMVRLLINAQRLKTLPEAGTPCIAGIIKKSATSQPIDLFVGPLRSVILCHPFSIQFPKRVF